MFFYLGFLISVNFFPLLACSSCSSLCSVTSNRRVLSEDALLLTTRHTDMKTVQNDWRRREMFSLSTTTNVCERLAESGWQDGCADAPFCRNHLVSCALLVATKRAYMPLCRSVGRSVGRSIARSIARSLGPSVTPSKIALLFKLFELRGANIVAYLHGKGKKVPLRSVEVKFDEEKDSNFILLMF